MRLVEEIGAQVLTAKSDSQLVIGQVNGKSRLETHGPYSDFPLDKTPSDLLVAKKLRRKATKYALISQQWYRRGLSYPYLKCIDLDEDKYAMREIHEGVCRTHIGGHALACKIARDGYYWSTLKRDCTEFVKSRSYKGSCGQDKSARQYNTKVFPRKLKNGDLVLRRVLKDSTSNKLTPNWEDPYRIIEEIRKDAFQLEHLDGKKVPHT
ncbi:hypothetical protein CR513_46952, partial [Mucuna pruriens]